MSMHLTLMGNASRGLPRTGLVALYDPYRDAYGRNVSITTTAGIFKENLTESTGTFLETSATSYHVAYLMVGSVTGQAYSAQFTITPVGRKRFMVTIGGPIDNTWAVFDTTTVALIAKGSSVSTTPAIVSNGDGTYTLTLQCSAGGTFGISIYSMPDAATDNTSRSFAGDTSKGFTLHQWQVNLGPVLSPYSAPAGAPGTLQVCADRWGGLYPLQLGSGGTGDTADPSFTGVSMVHAGDYLISGNLTGVTMAGDWSLPLICKPSGTANTLVSLAASGVADQYQAIEYNGSTKVRIKTANGATVTTSDDLTVSATAVQMLILTSSGDTLTLKRMDTGTSVTATNADPTGTPRLCVGALGTSTVGSAADALAWHLLPLYGRAWTAGEEMRAYVHAKSLMARRGVTLA